MVKLEKIVCFIFTLFVVYLINKQCLVEGIINLNSFTNCVDDPRWYTLDNDGQKHYCKDIGESASCYDMDPSQQEGWERCLETCGNCANTSVTVAAMDNSALYSGGTGEDFDRVDIDDSRKWLGLGVGDEDTMDVRESLTRDEEDDIVNIFDRLETVEDLYDMLLSSISPCLDCSIYDENECDNNSSCVYSGGECVTQSTSENKFLSCNGTELECSYDIKDIGDNSVDGNTVDGNTLERTYVKQNCETDGECSIVFPTYEFNCNNIPIPSSATHEYNVIKYEPKPAEQRWCLKPAYFNMDRDVSNILKNIHNIENLISHIQSTNINLRNSDKFKDFSNSFNDLISYIRSSGEQVSNYSDILAISISNIDSVITDTVALDIDQNTLFKLSEIKTKLTLLDINEGLLSSIRSSYGNYINNITPINSPNGHDCIEDVLTNGNIQIIENTTNVTITNSDEEIITDWTEGELINLSTRVDDTTVPTELDTSICQNNIKISIDSNGGLSLNKNNLINVFDNYESEEGGVDNLLISLSQGGTQSDNYTPLTADELESVSTNCSVSRIPHNNIIEKCYKLDASERIIDTTYTPSLANESCANYCVDSNEETNFISVYNEEHCRCFRNIIPSIDSGDNRGFDPNYATYLEGNRCSLEDSELLDKGVTSDIQHIPIAGLDTDNEIRKNCKSYFLLENSLSQEDIDTDAEDSEDIISNIDNMTDRISLYDICPTQCKAVGCVS